MTNHVPTLETCQKLKEVGYPQTTFFNYSRSLGLGGNFRLGHKGSIETREVKERCAAPILTEILEQLPDGVQISVFWRKGGELSQEDSLYKAWIPGKDEGTSHEPYPDQVSTFDKKPAEAAALLYLALHEGGQQ